MKKFAVFDIDGTLIRWQLYHAVVNTLAKQKLLGEDAYRAIRGARQLWKVRSHDEAFKDYEQKVIDVFEQAFDSLRVSDFTKAANDTVKEYKDQTYTYTRDLIVGLKQKGYVLLAISGSQQELVESLANHYGFDYWAGTVYEQSGGRFTGKKKIASLDKANILRGMTKSHNLAYEGSYAIGDSLSDAPMLGLVENPIAFNPDKKLFEVAKTRGWKIVVERKNVIYELRPDGGRYLLA